MLKIEIPEMEIYDENTCEFSYIKKQTLTLEHSLVSISKWESKWEKPFLSKEGMTLDQTIDYIRCMTLTQNVNEEIYKRIPSSEIDKVSKYISAPMTATWFNDGYGNKKGTNSGEIITSEIIYYWMIALNIPVEFQKWHLNRLLTLIKVCNIKNAPQKKMSKREILNRNRELNNARREAMGTRG